MLTLLLLTGLFADLPETTLAAVVIAAVAELVHAEAMRRLYRCVSGPLKEIYGPAARGRLCRRIGSPPRVSWVFDTLPGLFIGIGCVGRSARLQGLASARGRARARSRPP